MNKSSVIDLTDNLKTSVISSSGVIDLTDDTDRLSKKQSEDLFVAAMHPKTSFDLKLIFSIKRFYEYVKCFKLILESCARNWLKSTLKNRKLIGNCLMMNSDSLRRTDFIINGTHFTHLKDM